MQNQPLDASWPTRFRKQTDTFCARAVMVVVLCVLAWAPLAFGSTPPGAFVVVVGLTALAAILWAVRIWVQRPFRLLWTPMCWAVLAFCLYAVARCRWVEVEIAGRQELVRVLVYGTLFFVVVNNLNRTRSTAIVSLALIGIGFGVAMFAVFQLASHSTRIWGVARPDQYLGRASGTFFNPNHMAGYLGMIAPLALAYTVIGRFSPTVKVVLAYCSVTMLVGIAVSLSRGGVVAAAFALAVFCLVLLAQRDFWIPALVTLVLLTGVGVVLVTQTSSLQSRMDMVLNHNSGGDLRPAFWESAIRLFARDRLWGIGPGQFDIEFPSVRPAIVQQRPHFAHNDYLNTLCDWGLVGMLIITGACVLLYAGVFKSWRGGGKGPNDLGPRNSDRAAFAVGASVGVLCIIAHCVVEFDMQIPAIAVTVVILMALLTAHWRFSTEEYWRNPGRLGKIVLTLITLTAAGWLSTQALREGREAFWLARAKAPAASEQTIAASALKANDAEPMDWEADYKLGEFYWGLSLEDRPDYIVQANEALNRFGDAMRLNPFDGYSPVAYGMCLDRLGRTNEATAYFEKAEHNDPNNSYVVFEIGRHRATLGDYADAKRWVERALVHPWSHQGWEEMLAEQDLIERQIASPFYTAPAK